VKGFKVIQVLENEHTNKNDRFIVKVIVFN